MEQIPRADGDARTVILCGALSVDRAQGLKEELLEALGEAGNLRVDLENVEKISVACLQVLCAAFRYARDRGIALEFTNPSPAFAKGAADAGIPWPPGSQGVQDVKTGERMEK
ncbi:MAG: STAS domain-containing protein [Deltaproteobacteria bacterium]|nr:STAS domain-containing protein [Deltaproteobacteria bacterium]